MSHTPKSVDADGYVLVPPSWEHCNLPNPEALPSYTSFERGNSMASSTSRASEPEHGIDLWKEAVEEAVGDLGIEAIAGNRLWRLPAGSLVVDIESVLDVANLKGQLTCDRRTETVAVQVVKLCAATDVQVQRALRELTTMMHVASQIGPSARAFKGFVYEPEKHLLIVTGLLTGSVASWLRESGGKLAFQDAVRMAHAASDDLVRLHDCGVLHCAISPTTLMRTRSGRIRLADLSASHICLETPLETSCADVPANLHYCSPEQADEDNVTDRSDVWSLAASITFAVTGCKPYGNALPEAIRTAHAHGWPPHLPDGVCPSAELVQLLRQCLSMEPTDRPSAVELRSKLASILAAASLSAALPDRDEEAAVQEDDEEDGVDYVYRWYQLIPADEVQDNGDERNGEEQLCCVRLHKDSVNSKRYVRDMLLTAVPCMTKVESAYILQKVYGTDVCCVRVWPLQRASHLVANLRARGLTATLEPFCGAHNTADTQQMLALPQGGCSWSEAGLLYRVLLHVDDRHDMQHMQHVFNVLVMVKEKVTREIAEAVMQEAHSTGSALVCICSKQEAEQWVSWLRVNKLKSSIQPHW